ncbi:hypothetical protein CYMTET_18221, partial [Cymbomonas tetramitiformis]
MADQNVLFESKVLRKDFNYQLDTFDTPREPTKPTTSKLWLDNAPSKRREHSIPKLRTDKLKLDDGLKEKLDKLKDGNATASLLFPLTARAPSSAPWYNTDISNRYNDSSGRSLWGTPRLEASRLSALLTRGPDNELRDIQPKNDGPIEHRGPYDRPAMMASMGLPYLPSSSVKAIFTYEKSGKDGRARESSTSRWKETALGDNNPEESDGARDVMNCLWSEKPSREIASNLERLNSGHRHICMESIINLLRNTGKMASAMSDMNASLQVDDTVNSIMLRVTELLQASKTVLHVLGGTLRGEDLLCRLGNEVCEVKEWNDIDENYDHADIVRYCGENRGIVGHCISTEMPVVALDALKHGHFCPLVDRIVRDCGHGVSVACIPIMDERYAAGGKRPNVLGVLQVAVGFGPLEGRSKKLSLEMKGLLGMLGSHAGRCLTNALAYCKERERNMNLQLARDIVQKVSTDMPIEEIANVVNAELETAIEGGTAAVFIVEPKVEEMACYSQGTGFAGPFPSNLGVVGLCQMTGRTVVEEIVAENKAFEPAVDFWVEATDELEGVLPEGHCRSIAVPVRVTSVDDGSVSTIAVLQVVKPLGARVFNELDDELMKMVAAQ